MKIDLSLLIRRFLDVILPPRCPSCGVVQMQDDALCKDCWHELNFIIAPQCECCGIPFEITINNDKNIYCGNCLTYPPYFTKARAVFHYNDISKKLVLNLKYGDRLDIIPTIRNWMITAGHEFINSEFGNKKNSIIIPVPLHKRRLFSRRFNQSGEIAKSIANKCGIAIELDILKRIKNTPSQGVLSIKKRHKNVAGAFQIKPENKHIIKDKIIILIDDVMTTGATANSCAKILKRAGVKYVYILCLTRAIKLSTKL